MKEKDRYKNNSQNNSYAILLQTSKSEADLIKRTLYEGFQLLKEAYDYAETLESPYKFMAIKKKTNFLSTIMSWLCAGMEYLGFFIVAFTGVFIAVRITLLPIIPFFPSSLETISALLFCVVMPFGMSLSINEYELKELKKKEQLTHDVIIFKEIINRLEKHVSKDTEKFKFKDRNIIFSRFIKIDYFIYDLFYRTKTFALESFLEADRIQDYDTQFSIIKPMVEDISDEILIAYRKHKQIEIEAAELQKQKLKEQVKYDLHAYENRVLEEKKGGFE